ncbi:MAG: T9SS type A sorting domain-containing protein, partial [Bacteroidota bacterium]
INDTYLHANNIRALLNNSGSLFLDKGGNAQFQAPFTNTDSPNSIFAAGLWLGGINAANELFISAPTYGYAGNSPANRDYDYLPGPLDTDGNLAPNCENWDNVWSVARFEIEQHQADYADNNTVDQPLPAIYEWPGRGNPYFEELNGFALPTITEPLAPFFDNNNDGVYNPDDGDYPIVLQSTTLPQQITWSVFNDLSTGESGINEPLGFEIQLTTWAFNCSDNMQLNNTIFTSYKIINRSNAPLDSLHVGIWNDFDIGCFDDDLVGSAPELNTFFAYDIGQDEPDCSNPYEGIPPIQATTILNEDLSYAMRIGRPGTSSGPATTDPNLPTEFYNFLTGRWNDGTPLTFGGTGYDETGTNPITPFIFPNDPSDPMGWSQPTSGLPEGDVRSVGSVEIGSFAPGQIQTIDVAYSTFIVDDGDTFSNLDGMYEGLSALQNWYDSNFEGVCTAPLACEEDCLWPGDTDADGIANHCDLLPIALKFDATGPLRNPPLIWASTTSESWGDQQADGTDTKHVDANGDGVIDATDFEITLINFDRTTPDYITPDDIYPPIGPDLFFTTAPTTNNFQDLEADDSFIGILRLDTISDLVGIALTIEYDTRYFASLEPLFATDLTPPTMRFARERPNTGEVDFVRITTDGTPIEAGSLVPMQVNLPEVFLEPLPADTSVIRVKNIKAIRADGSIIAFTALPITATFQGITVSTDEPEIQQEHLKVFPNPTNAQVTIQAEGQLIEAVQLLSSAGQEVLSRKALSEQQTQLSIGHLPKGLYLLRVKLSKQWTVRKIIVE